MPPAAQPFQESPAELQIPRFARNDKGKGDGEESAVAIGHGGCWDTGGCLFHWLWYSIKEPVSLKGRRALELRNKNPYQRKPNVTGNIFTVPVPTLLFELVGEFTQT